MNFEFLKGLKGLGYIYENCNNAEKLAISMPVQSVFTSRKSAELLAKFLYLAAHNQALEGMNFADILSDKTFQQFINSRGVMNAFHYIRRTGNRAVHGDECESSEEAIAVLQDLHYVAGESACILGLLKKYPEFDEHIKSYPDAKVIEEKDIEQKAQNMFLQYVEEYNAQVERDGYYSRRIQQLEEEFKDLVSPFVFSPAIEYMNEILDFPNKPLHPSTIRQIQEHFVYIGNRAIKYLQQQNRDSEEIRCEVELTIRGKNGYSTTNLIRFVHGILYDLPDADGFEIKSYSYGPAVYPVLDLNVTEDFSETVSIMGEHEQFTYKYYKFYFNSGESTCQKFMDGEWVNLKTLYSASIIDADFDQTWAPNQVVLYLDFDFEKYMNILNTLHDCVRKYVPKEDLEYCENMWEDEDFSVLYVGDWAPKKLREIQSFLDEINKILAPIMSECSAHTTGGWYIEKAPLAVAECEWSEKGFTIIGTAL